MPAAQHTAQERRDARAWWEHLLLQSAAPPLVPLPTLPLRIYLKKIVLTPLVSRKVGIPELMALAKML